MPKKRALISLAALAAVTFGVVTFAVMGSSATPPEALSPQVQKYYDENVANAKATLPAATPSAAIKADEMLRSVQAVVAGSKPMVISVLGDSTGNAAGEWVDLWAQHLAKRATVTVHEWDQDADDWKVSPMTYGTGARDIVIWNGSQPGTTYTYPLARLTTIQPEKPTFTILNFGHNQAAKTADIGSAELLAAVNKKWRAALPAVVTLQNPSQADRAPLTASSVKALSAWARRTGYPTINVNKAFVDAGNLAALLQDNVHPNPAGERIWADTVAATLG